MNTIFKERTQKKDLHSSNGKVCMISPDNLFPNPSQPRFIFEDEPLLRLADSIRRFGILQPLSVRPSRNSDGVAEAYQIIAGERRWRAARILGLKLIPCLILDIDNQSSAELALIENIQREDLNIFEQAAAIASLIDIYGLTQEQAARQLSSSQAYIANKLRILKLTPKERAQIIKNKLTERHARALLRIDDPEVRLEVISHVSAKELNVSATERYIDSLLTSQQPSHSVIKPYLKDLRFFYNSVDKATSILKDCGFNVTTERNELPLETLITIRIPHKT